MYNDVIYRFNSIEASREFLVPRQTFSFMFPLVILPGYRLFYIRNNRFKLRMHFQWNFIHREILIFRASGRIIISFYHVFKLVRNQPEHIKFYQVNIVCRLCPLAIAFR